VLDRHIQLGDLMELNLFLGVVGHAGDAIENQRRDHAQDRYDRQQLQQREAAVLAIVTIRVVTQKSHGGSPGAFERRIRQRRFPRLART
jgi:hypothetical protein